MQMVKNRRVDKLLNVLLVDVANYFIAKENLLTTGRIRSRRHESMAAIRQRAEQLTAKGWVHKVTKGLGGAYQVPSEGGKETYLTAPAEQFCSCSHNQSGGRVCKHLHLLFLISLQRNSKVPTKEILQKDLKRKIINEKLVKCAENSVEEYVVQSPATQQTYMVRVTSNICTCNHFAHAGWCVCLEIVRSIALSTLDLIEASGPTQSDANLTGSVEQPFDADELDTTTRETNDRDIPTQVINEKPSVVHRLERLLHHAETDQLTPQAATYIEEAYNSQFSCFDGTTKQKKMEVLNPNRKSKGSMTVKLLERASTDFHTKPRIKQILRKKANSESVDSNKFKATTSKTVMRKRRKGYQIYGEVKKKKQDLIAITSELTVPRNVKEYLNLQKERCTIFPRHRPLQIIFVNGIMENLERLFSFVPDCKELCRNELISYFV